ncbi:MAG: cache domain-containing protein, partial [Burkholderiaceae bacterium]
MDSRSQAARSWFWGLGRKSINLQLAVLVLVALLPALLAAIWHLVQDRERDRRVARDQVRQIAINVSSRLQGQLDDFAGTMTLLADQPQVRAMQPSLCDPLIGSLVRLNPDFAMIGTRDLDGKPICTFRPDPISAEQMRQSPWFRSALALSGFHASEALLSPKTQRWVTMLTTPIRDDAGAVVGVVTLPLDLSALNEAVMRDLPPGVLVTVLDQQWQIVQRSEGLSEQLSRRALQHRDSLQAAASANASGMIDLTGAEGVPRVFAYRLLAETGWLVVAGLPRAEIFGAADAALRKSAWAGLALLVLSLALAWRLSRGIVRPLAVMAATSSRVAAGDMDARMDAPDASADIAE